MKTLLVILFFLPLILTAQYKQVISNGGDLEGSVYTLSSTYGQAFTNQSSENYAFSEGFQQHHLQVVPGDVEFDFKVQPNPTAGALTISAKAPIKEVMVYTSRGRLIKTIQINALQSNLNLSEHPSGVYFIQIVIDNNQTSFQKIIKL